MVFPLVVPSTQVGVVFPIVNRNDWRGEFSDETVWQTAINPSKVSGAEERESRVSRPTRIFSALCTGLGRLETARLLSNAFQTAKAPQAMPIYQDFSEVSSAGTTTIGLDTTNRRIFVGQRLLFVDPDFSLVIGGAGPYQAQVGSVASMTTTSVTLSAALSASVPVGTLVFPLVDCEVALSKSINIITDSVGEWTQTYRELSGQSTLPAESTADISAEYPYFQGHPIWTHSYEWREDITVGVVREGSSAPSGNTDLISVSGDNPLLRFEGSYETYDRASQWKMARFFDSRRGRALPFWAINPVDMFQNFTIVNSTNVQFTNFAAEDHLIPFLETIALVAVDGTMSLHRVSGFDGSAAVVDVILTDAIADISKPILHATSAHLCRWDQDNLKRTWITDGVCRFSIAHRSLQKEGSYVLL